MSPFSRPHVDFLPVCISIPVYAYLFLYIHIYLTPSPAVRKKSACACPKEIYAVKLSVVCFGS